MSFWQPRSILQLVLLGFFTALAPLGIAILFTVQTLAELAADNAEVTNRIVAVTRLGQEVQRDLLELERRARQYLALADADLASLFEREQDLLAGKLQVLQQRMLVRRPEVTDLQRSIASLSLVLPEDGSPATSAAAALPGDHLDNAFARISKQGRAVELLLQLSVDRLLEQNAKEAESVIEALVLQMSLLAAATLALLLFFAYWINRPVQDLTQEIHQLGTAGLSHRIEISGPQEMQVLGGKLEWLRQQLHETEQQKQQFLRHISHELKTPLSSLREGADLLAEQVPGRLSQQQREIVEIVRQNAIELQRLIENLLDYNQLPNQELRFEDVELEPLLQELLGHYRLGIDRKGLQLSLRGEPPHWRADIARLRTSLDNLLSNAVNYAADDGIIDIAWFREGANLVIDVANTGNPIPPEDAERVFEPFFQSAARRSGAIKGSGIGLSVARDCIEAQGGSLSLVSHARFPICFRLICPAH